MQDRKTNRVPPFGIVLIDSHPFYCEGVKAKISSEQNYFIAAQASCGVEGVSCACEISPDFALVDAKLPDVKSADLVRELIEKCVNLSVLMTGEKVKLGDISAAFDAGASGYVDKLSAPCELVRAMDSISRGNFYLDDAIDRKIKRDFSICKKVHRNLFCPSLTPREHEIMHFLVNGLTVQGIAEKLFVSPRTVENHRSNLMRKLGVKTSLGFIKLAYRHGLIDLDE